MRRRAGVTWPGRRRLKLVGHSPRKGSDMRWSSAVLALIVALVLMAACRSTLAPGPDGSIAGPSPKPSPPAPSDSLGPSPAPSLTPLPTGSYAAVPTPTNSFVGSVVTTLADDGLRVRSKRRVSDDSFK